MSSERLGQHRATGRAAHLMRTPRQQRGGTGSPSGANGPASDAALTPEGHGIRYRLGGEVIGVTIINARFILSRDGHITITLPHQVRVDEDVLAPA